MTTADQPSTSAPAPAFHERVASKLAVLLPLLLPLAVLLLLFEPLFLDASLLGYDNRLFPPFRIHLQGDEPARPMNLLTSDVNAITVPDTISQIDRIKRGEVPLWNPGAILGQPLLANQMYAPFYPETLLYFLFEPLRAYPVSMALHLLLLGFGMQRFLKARGLGRSACTLGAIAITFSGFVGVHLHLSNFVRVLAWLPLQLLAAERVVESANRRRIAWLAFVCGLPLLAGFPQLAMINLYAVFFWFLGQLMASCTARPWETFFAGLLGFALGVVLSLVHLLPSAELLENSWRRDGLDSEKSSFKSLEPELLIGLVLPHFFGNPIQDVSVVEPKLRELESFPSIRTFLEKDAQNRVDVQNNFVENTLYVGLVPLVFALFALRKRGRLGDLFFGWVMVLGLAVALDVPGVASLARALPGFSFGSPKRVLFLVTFAFAWLAASGLSQLWETSELKRSRFLTSSGMVLFLFGALALLPFERWLFPHEKLADQIEFRSAMLPDFLRCMLVGIVLLTLSSKKYFRIPLVSLSTLLLLSALDLVVFARAANPPQPLKDQYKSTPGIDWLASHLGPTAPRFASFGREELLNGSIAQIFGLRALGGIAPMVMRETGELLRTLDPVLLKVNDPRYVMAIKDREALQRPLLDLLGVAYVVVGDQRHALSESELVYRNDEEQMGIFRRPTVLPSAFFVRELRVIADKVSRLEALSSMAFKPAEIAILEEAGEDLPLKDWGAGTCTLAWKSPEHFEVQTHCESPAFLVVSEPHFPGWRAYVDEQPILLHRVDHAFMGVSVPVGDHCVAFRYAPQSFRFGVSFSITAAVIILALFMLSVIKPAK